ncbi:MAG: triose-phosphate isomerase [Chloroflexi bacterium]|nr:triose-phosphate isomerase [Chloroflexota bacterium]
MSSSRRPMIAGNWKMNTTPADGRELAAAIASGSAAYGGVDVVICPPFTGIASAADAVSGTNVQVGAQNMSAEESGAYTGEVSASMLRGLVSYVIAGHSERRGLYCETDAAVAAKATAAHSAGFVPIVCVGENLETRKRGDAVSTVRSQLRASLSGYTGWDSLVVAYEPVWAIGTGEAASPQQAQEIIGELREELVALAGEKAAAGIRILYGGSVNSRNIGPFVDRPDIDGALVGGASLQADEFVRIVEMTARLLENPA